MRYIRFRFTRRWQDLDWIFEPGDEICLPEDHVNEARERMRAFVKYGLYVVPLSFLEEVKEK